jgi:TolB-like protein/DNA-binding winged helix-turn-helix (wHTH) protein/Tfp pilus assembly protein PilF
MSAQFGDVIFDDSRRMLHRAGKAVHVSPKAFQLLGILISKRPSAVSKADLQDELWPGTFVTEGNIPSLVAELRSALGDDARNPRYIRTVHGFGYSFEASVQEISPPEPTADPIVERQEAEPAGIAETFRPEQTAPRWRSWWPAAGIALLVIASGLALLISSRKPLEARPNPAQPLIRSIAVLPFVTAATEETDSHLGLGLADLVITRLSNVRELAVSPTSAVRPFASGEIPSRDAGRRLGVDAVLEGSVRTSGDRVRVTVQLLDVEKQKPIWAETFDEPRSHMFAIEDRISTRVADALLLRLSPAERSLLVKHFTDSPEAYQDYVRGRFQLYNGGAAGPADAPERAAAFFKRALERDPVYALAWAGLADAHASIAASGRGRASENWATAEAAARRALELEPALIDAQIPLAQMQMFWTLDYPGAERDLRRILAAQPANSAVLLPYGYLLQCLGRFDESLAVRTRALELDPLNPASHWGVANTYLTARNWPLARKKIEELLEMQPTHHQANIGMIRVLIAEQRYAEAVRFARKLNEWDSRPINRAFLGYALARNSERDEALSILQELQRPSKGHISPFIIAILLAGLGDLEAAFPVLERVVDEREHAIRLNTEPLFDPFRGDPRFQLLLRRAGFSRS